MYCHHGIALKSPGGGTLTGYFVECLSGETVVPIYADNAGSPIASLSGVTDRAKTDARGNFFFYVTDGTYNLKYYDDNGVYQFTETGFTMDGGGLALREDLADSSGAAMIGTGSGGTVQSELNARPTSAVLADDTGAALVGTTGGGNVQSDINARPTSTTLADDAGSSLIGFIQSGTGAVARTAQSKMREVVSVNDFGAVGDGVADDTAEIIAAITAVFNAGGGTVFFPTGTYMVSSVAFNFTGGVTVNLKGAGKRSTILKKITGTSSPILDLSADLSVLDVYSEISDLRLMGDSKGNPGYKTTRMARCVLRNVAIDTCSYGVDSYGSLAQDYYNCTIQSNNTGYRSQKSGTIRANLIQFFGGQIGDNSAFGMDIGDAAGVHLYGTDLSANGTAANTATGAIMLRATMDDETGYSSFSFNGGWLEANYGRALQTEAVAGLFLTLKDIFASGNESGRVANISGIYSSHITNIVAGGGSDEVIVSANYSFVAGGLIGALTDTSTHYRHIAVATTSVALDDVFKGNFKEHKLVSQRYLVGDSSLISGGGSDSVDYYLYGTGKHRFISNGQLTAEFGPNTVGFYGTSAVTKQAITGALSAVTDASAKAVLTSILSLITTTGLGTNSTS